MLNWGDQPGGLGLGASCKPWPAANKHTAQGDILICDRDQIAGTTDVKTLHVHEVMARLTYRPPFLARLT